MRCYKVKTYEEIERDIDSLCILLGIIFWLIYFTLLTCSVLFGI